MGLPSPSDLTNAVSNAQAAVASAPANAQAAWNAATTTDANDARVQQGVSDAASLISNGFDQSNPGDQQKLVGAIAGAVSAIPGVGHFLGAAIEVLFQVGQAISDACEALGLVPKDGCHHTGPPFDPGDILAGWKARGADTTPGTFGALAWPVFALNYANWLNCQRAWPNSLLMLGLVQLWNANGTGPMVNVYAPMTGHVLPLSDHGEPFSDPAQVASAFLYMTIDPQASKGPLHVYMQPQSALVQTQDVDPSAWVAIRQTWSPSNGPTKFTAIGNRAGGPLGTSRTNLTPAAPSATWTLLIVAAMGAFAWWYRKRH